MHIDGTNFYVYDKESSRILYRTAHERTAKSWITRAAGAGKVVADECGISDVKTYHEEVEQMVERTNLRTGEKFWESVNTPIHCSPAFESYWSM